jgi:outer membrane protein TolC
MKRRLGEREIGRILRTFFLRLPVSPVLLIVVYCSAFFAVGAASAEELNLRDLVNEALKNSPEILAAQYRVSASRYRIPQAESLPDPMVMFGYQNEGWNRYSFGEMQMSWWMFSASQMFPFPGKLSLKGEMASKDSEGLQASYESVRLKVVTKVRELYYDLFLAYKNIDLIKDRASLFSRIEDAAVARYSSGMGLQQEVLMAQTEKYMLREKEEMQRQKIQSLDAMLNSTLGRGVDAPMGRPSEPSMNAYVRGMNELLKMAYEQSPEVRAKERMVASTEVKVRMAEKEYYPDFTVTANVMKRRGEFDDMWSLTTAMNIPLFYRTKQRQAVNEAKVSLAEARSELEATKLMLSSSMRDNFSMMKSAERLMELYKDGLIPKTYQDFESALAGYAAGKAEAITVISRLKALLEFETLYWGQFVEREKAASRLSALAGIVETGGE